MLPSYRKPPDFLLFATVCLLLSIGLIMVFSSSFYYAMFPPFNSHSYFLKRQAAYAVLGVSGMLVMMRYDYRNLQRLAPYALLLAFGLLIAVLTPLGDSRLGAQRWLDLGIISFQPSDLAKLCLVVFTACSMAQNRSRIHTFRYGMLPYLLIMIAAGGLIMLEPDLGTTLTLLGTIYIMMFVAGVQFGRLLVLAGVGVAAIALLIYFEPYRLRRLLAFLDPEKDPTGAGWHILNSLMSLGSGGLLGLGLGQGRHSKFLYLPERQTDFIFAVIGEELGFIGAALVILLFVLFVWRGLKIAVAAPDAFGSMLAAGIVIGIGLQAFINIGVVTSTLPITGITLPFISFGGTSLVFNLLAVGILLNISRQSR